MTEPQKHQYRTEDGNYYSWYGIYGDPEDGRGNKSQREDSHDIDCPCGWYNPEKKK